MEILFVFGTHLKLASYTFWVNIPPVIDFNLLNKTVIPVTFYF